MEHRRCQQCVSPRTQPFCHAQVHLDSGLPQPRSVEHQAKHVLIVEVQVGRSLNSRELLTTSLLRRRPVNVFERRHLSSGV